MSNIIDEYLVKLGAVVDQSGMQRFQQALREAAQASEASAASIAGAFVKAQTEIVGGFAAIGSAAVGLVDKVAMADQSYRLFALHMYMSKDAARSLKVAMDALGEPLENLTWDAELRARTQQLIADQRAMAPDGNFDAQMRRVRDIRFEFTRMEVELQYLSMHVVNDFLTSLGLGPDTLLQKLQGFNNWVTHNLPDISHRILSLVMPVWQDLKQVFLATGEAIQATALAFTNLIGLLTGDHSIEGTAFNLEKTGQAIGKVVHGMAVFAEAIANVEGLLAHLVNALVLVASGNFSGAYEELGAAFHEVTAKAVGAALGGVGGFFLGGGVGVVPGAALGSVIADKAFGTTVQASTRDTANVSSLLASYAASSGVSPALVAALANVESGQRQYDASGNLIKSPTGALGVMQLTRATAAALGVDRTDTEANIRGGVTLLAHLLSEYGSVPNAIAAYHEGEPKMNAILAGRATLSPEARAEVAAVMRQLGQHGTVQVGTIVVNVDKPNAVNADVGVAVAAKLRRMQTSEVQRNLYEFQDVSYGY